MEGNRVLRTVVLTDAVGFTARMRANEPEALASIADDKKIFEHHFHAHGGTVVKSTGDGFLVVFESAASAVLATREAQKELIQSSFRHRIGIHAGEVTLTADDAYGDTVNVCARLEEMANPGEIIVSDTVYELVRAQAFDQPKFLGSRTLKGISNPVKLYSWQHGSAPRRLSPHFYKWIGLAVLISIVSSLALLNRNSWGEQDSNSSTVALLQDVRNRRRENPSTNEGNNSVPAEDIDLIMDEAYEQVMEELDAFADAKADAIKKCDAGVVLKWLGENPFGKRERGIRELEHWTLVDIAIKRGKELAGAKAGPQDIAKALTTSKSESDKLARKAFQEEFATL